MITTKNVLNTQIQSRQYVSYVKTTYNKEYSLGFLTRVVSVLARVISAMFTSGVGAPSIVRNNRVLNRTFVVKPRKEICTSPITARPCTSVRPNYIRFVRVYKLVQLWNCFLLK